MCYAWERSGCGKVLSSPPKLSSAPSTGICPAQEVNYVQRLFVKYKKKIKILKLLVTYATSMMNSRKEKQQNDYILSSNHEVT